MKVNQLIKELKNMPQNLEVNVAMHDNAEYEIAGNVFTVELFIKNEYTNLEFETNFDRDIFNDMPEKCVIIGC